MCVKEMQSIILKVRESEAANYFLMGYLSSVFSVPLFGSGTFIPKGLHQSAQGCEVRATLGKAFKMTQP